MCGDGIVNAGIMLYLFVVGACVGSFLNVVIYRLPRGLFLSENRSFCPSCGYKIRLRENIPVVSWFALRGKCSNCGGGISPRYVIIEIFTGLFFALMYYFYFSLSTVSFSRSGTDYIDFFDGGWWLYLASAILFACLIAASAIDYELYLIPMSLCIFATIFGLITTTFAPFFVEFWKISDYNLFAICPQRLGGAVIGASAGLILANIMLATGVIKRSFDGLELEVDSAHPETISDNPGFNDRVEVMRECVFLLPIIVGAILGLKFISDANWFTAIEGNSYVKCLLGAMLGYFAGAGIVWITRIFGTLAFGREAMGLGDVHLMGAIGKFCGAIPSIVIFFIAPFFGLTLALIRLFSKKIKEIPYGPFLSIAAVFVIIFREAVLGWLSLIMGFPGQN